MVVGILEIDILFELGVGRLVLPGGVTDQKIRTPDDVRAFELWLVDDGDALAHQLRRVCPRFGRNDRLHSFEPVEDGLLVLSPRFRRQVVEFLRFRGVHPAGG